MSLILLIKKLPKLFTLPAKEICWFLMLFPLSGLIRAMLLFVPFKFYRSLLGAHYDKVQLSSLVLDSEKQLAWRIGILVKLVSRYTPWESMCLVQAIMARVLFGYYGIPYVLHLGVKLTQDNKEPIKAHAWTIVGPWIITGRGEHKGFTVVNTFIAPSICEKFSPAK
ncbi:lasso peptide biosynthesis B2 protein [Pseudoalteromonas phenolica]|jgi:hypothetical protein|uniref:lasso peptide biosynthesis B2 protein n=1 Tax=Pseudoalteromonas phenolica TaxID=161398 RepID=UPI00384E6370